MRFVRHQGRKICGNLEDGSDLSEAIGDGRRVPKSSLSVTYSAKGSCLPDETKNCSGQEIRIDKASISFDSRHPVIIPSKHHVFELIIRTLS